jgi:hypothetical protein
MFDVIEEFFPKAVMNIVYNAALYILNLKYSYTI